MFLIDKKSDEFILAGSLGDTTTKRLEKGMYNLEIRDMGQRISFRRNLDYAKGVVINEGIFKEVRETMTEFFTEEMMEARKALSMRNKLGLMFDGDPGTGKTFLAGQISEEICQKYDAIGILATKAMDYSDIIDGIRIDDPNRFIILIIDEFEKTFRSYDTDLLSFLSGAKERDNLIIISTVNDTSQLPQFIKDRPSRIEKVFNFTFKDEVVLRAITSNMIPECYKDKINLESLVVTLKEYKNMSIDRMRHILRDLIANQVRFEKTGELKSISVKDTELTSKSTIGFTKEVVTDYDPTTFLTATQIIEESKEYKILEDEEFTLNI